MAVVPKLTSAERRVLAKAGFREGVAYMPVPRCDACQFWDVRHGNLGECLVAGEDQYDDGQHARARKALGHAPKALGFGDGPEVESGGLMTDADFGCVQWKAKA